MKYTQFGNIISAIHYNSNVVVFSNIETSMNFKQQ